MVRRVRVRRGERDGVVDVGGVVVAAAAAVVVVDGVTRMREK